MNPFLRTGCTLSSSLPKLCPQICLSKAPLALEPHQERGNRGPWRWHFSAAPLPPALVATSPHWDQLIGSWRPQRQEQRNWQMWGCTRPRQDGWSSACRAPRRRGNPIDGRSFDFFSSQDLQPEMFLFGSLFDQFEVFYAWPVQGQDQGCLGEPSGTRSFSKPIFSVPCLVVHNYLIILIARSMLYLHAICSNLTYGTYPTSLHDLGEEMRCLSHTESCPTQGELVQSAHHCCQALLFHLIWKWKCGSASVRVNVRKWKSESVRLSSRHIAAPDVGITVVKGFPSPE